MKTTIETSSGPILVQTFIDPRWPAGDTVHIASGPFLFPIRDAQARKALIAALLEADAELDAAAERAASKKEGAA